MAAPTPNSYPEQRPNLQGLDQREAFSLTLEALFGAAEEHALNGERERSIQAPLIYQNNLTLPDTRTVYVAKYMNANATEIAIGEKMLDILIIENESVLAEGEPRSRIHTYRNYYFVNAGLDTCDQRSLRIEKHDFSCHQNDLEPVLLSNHFEDDPEYIVEKSLDFTIIREEEAFMLAGIIIRHLQDDYQDS